MNKKTNEITQEIQNFTQNFTINTQNIDNITTKIDYECAKIQKYVIKLLEKEGYDILEDKELISKKHLKDYLLHHTFTDAISKIVNINMCMKDMTHFIDPFSNQEHLVVSAPTFKYIYRSFSEIIDTQLGTPIRLTGDDVPWL